MQKYGAFILLTSSLLSTLVTASEEEKLMNNDNTEVLTTIMTMTSAFNNKNIDGVLSNYEDGASVMFEAGEKISDAAVLREMFEGAFQVNPQFEYPNGHEVYIANNVALHLAPWRMVGQAPDGTTFEQSGLSVAVLRKQENGKWLLLIDNPHGQSLMENN
ncbi:hypothetical protein tinsulaeT_06580 [Thalassotalea insulae]|uniref:DUF4440 domain-containing protein n=1 Tax=Thalassotalea insulae TaxID=2056778 RepID=A0ABQ6GMU8_9GAMM|nr:DUF4440 domain-containing protein [Thalassotalea insulae]GLX77318.1 hypothetical protein tinsulaeT_06580 [Thalassotalea insulae]